MIFVARVTVFAAVLVTANAQYGRCVDPNNRNGLCQPIRSCQSILELLTPPLSPQVRDFLRRSQCKFENHQPWVCCPDSVPPPVLTPSNIGTSSVGSGGSQLPSVPDCGIQAADRIVGGEPTAIDEFPWLVQIQYNKPGNKVGFHCGGSLINQRYVITAAHCVNKVPAEWSLTSVRIGEWDTKTNNPDCETLQNEQVCNEPILDVPVEEKIVHEDYQPNSKNQHNDIALLRLARYVTYTDFVRPICLPVESALRNSNENGKRFVVAGWGKTEHVSTATKKLKVDIDAYTNAKCQQVYQRSNNLIVDGQICAGGEAGRDSCNGDSGGPLMREYAGGIPYWYLTGVVSYGPKNCGTPDIPGVYTRVSKYIDWIKKNIKD